MAEKVILERKTLEKILSDIRNITVGTIGDVCLDLYLFADMRLSELSRETPHYPLPVTEEKAGPGGGGNVIANISALCVKKILPVSLIGNDWRGYILEDCFDNPNIDTSYILKSGSRITNCYCKPIRRGISDVSYEDPRLDFENRTPLSIPDEERIIDALKETVKSADILLVSDQLRNGIITPRIREIISSEAKNIPVIVDSRDNAGLYENVIVKPNEIEACALAGNELRDGILTVEELEKTAGKISGKNNMPVIITAGEKGSLWCDESGTYYAEGIKANGAVDTVGAGDTFLSAFGCAYASGASGKDAIAFANLASAVTVRKIGTTGTASPDEILAVYEENFL